MTRIRQAIKGDEHLIETILLTKIEELKQKGIEQWEKEEVLWTTLKDEYAITDFYIAYKESQVVGCFCVVDYDPTYWYHDKPKESLYIHKVSVLNVASGQGIGDDMLSYFKELGRKAKLPCVKLDVRAHKEKLRSFYERNGFTLVEVADLGKGYETALYQFIID